MNYVETSNQLRETLEQVKSISPKLSSTDKDPQGDCSLEDSEAMTRALCKKLLLRIQDAISAQGNCVATLARTMLND